MSYDDVHPLDSKQNTSVLQKDQYMFGAVLYSTTEPEVCQCRSVFQTSHRWNVGDVRVICSNDNVPSVTCDSSGTL